MKFYTQQHKFYCGIDLHARTLYVCILNQAGEIVLHRNMKTDPAVLLKVIAPYRDDLVVAVECIFTCGTGWRISALKKAYPLCLGMRST